MSTDPTGTGVFPALLEPARQCADQILRNSESRVCELSEWTGFWVCRRIDVKEEDQVIHPFSHGDEEFVLFQKGGD